jgi:hypothetical protein
LVRPALVRLLAHASSRAHVPEVARRQGRERSAVRSQTRAERRFVRADDCYVETAFGPPLHIAQYSDRNSKRKVADWSEDGLFAWYADAPEGADRGALMVYRTQERRCEGWYAGLKRSADGAWAFGDTRGIDAYVSRRRDADRRLMRAATPTILA